VAAFLRPGEQACRKEKLPIHARQHRRKLKRDSLGYLRRYHLLNLATSETVFDDPFHEVVAQLATRLDMTCK